MEKQFYKKIYNITLCNCWHRSWSWPNTQHIQKLDTEDVWILRYSRSRVFTFVFFMQKLTGTSSGKNNKSCGIFHHESNKIGFSFFWFFCDFLRNLQESANLQILLKLYFCVEAPGKIRPFAMWPLAMAGGAGRPNSGEPLAGAGRARAGVDLGPRGPIPRLGCGGGGTG
jgi:hypothetical protein